MYRRSGGACAATAAIVLLWLTWPAAQTKNRLRAPSFQVDSNWPGIPNGWVLGEVSSIAVDARDRIWVLHRPQSIPKEQREKAAPPVLEFDQAGRLLASWGGPGDGYEWPAREHAIFVDAKEFVWISGNGGWPRAAAGSSDDMILKFTTAGKPVLQIGHRGQSTGNMDTNNVHQPADMFVRAPANELLVADGYGNQRIIVFDAENGRFKRMWGAFGSTPPAAMMPNPSAGFPNTGSPGPPQFGLVHAVKVSSDGIVYVADQTNNRIQTFTSVGEYLGQVQLSAVSGVMPAPAGFAFSPDRGQQFLYVADSGSMQVAIFDRETLTEIGRIGRRGAKPGEFDLVHQMATDSKGNLYTAEVATNRRAQKFVLRSEH